MTQAHSNASIIDMTYNPPPLPEYLSRNHTLNAIVGVPNDEEVKAIHDTIRAINIPALYDHKLFTQLAQYLFTVQMAVYRNEYPSGIFPGENTYIPPSIQSHFPIYLEPVVGAPSDEQLETVHGAVRTLEGLAHSPFFDATLSAKLSQHFFNIQFARYIRDANQGHFAQRPTDPAPPLKINENGTLATTRDRQPDIVEQQSLQEIDPKTPDPPTNLEAAIQVTPPISVQPESTAVSQVGDKLEQFCITQQETNQLLRGNAKILETIQRTLVSSHFAEKRARSYDRGCTYAAMNKNGDLPWMHGLESVYAKTASTLNRYITSQELTRYLKFYNIGSYFIEEETGNLRPGKEEDATRLLAGYLRQGNRVASQAA